MRAILLGSLIVVSVLFSAAPALASGSCSQFGTEVTCSGTSDSQYVPGQYVYVNNQAVYENGYYTQSAR